MTIPPSVFTTTRQFHVLRKINLHIYKGGPVPLGHIMRDSLSVDPDAKETHKYSDKVKYHAMRTMNNWGTLAPLKWNLKTK